MTDLSSPVEIAAASVSVSRIDGAPFTKEEVDTLVMALHDKVVEFVEAYDGAEMYNFVMGNTGVVNYTPELEVEEVQAVSHELGKLAEITDELEARKGEIAEAVQAEIDADDVEVGTEEEDGEESSFAGPATKSCTACHVAITQLDVNQCPLCGNPFLP